ncbi:methylglyoxal synthase [Pseudoalteromonas tunicata]|jgi:methylglyoxal synthase|uniref:Methylglyoxal synthase n=1 Tax=Pseudoalteromonas tunicata D2 TaxID=87626 RepID=A4C675_9GAMM|nr:methylglyoxal synthase [Pseudoalteromonas tunicata]ATC95452.1 methylglyoxal synthase [Pseudoalteromonas tunicata]AXT31029.1 methylglyoxal synthase [Pseudoalteromonas tunicata]EAR29479.1 methylglyoxal synthase [Pseudoalteromonas tunicata D2]MDP5212976.1 methylglyoxal synthase [Pseudoalteromonas tunicata]
MKTIQQALPAKKTIALVAHDGKKHALELWCSKHLNILSQHTLYGTGTTGHLIEKRTGLPVHKLLSGPLGGDQQLGALIAEHEIHLLIFFWDPLASQPHDPDVKALLRLAAVWNIPVACNESSADMLLSSPLMNSQMPREMPDYQGYLAQRLTI